MHLEAANLYLIQASTGWKPLASNSSFLVFVKLLVALTQFLVEIYPQHKATFAAGIKLQSRSHSQQRGEVRMTWRRSSFLSLEESPVVREEARRRSSVGKMPLLVNVHSGEEFGSERPWIRGVHEEGWQRIGQKALDGAGKSKKFYSYSKSKMLP